MARCYSSNFFVGEQDENCTFRSSRNCLSLNFIVSTLILLDDGTVKSRKQLPSRAKDRHWKCRRKGVNWLLTCNLTRYVAFFLFRWLFNPQPPQNPKPNQSMLWRKTVQNLDLLVHLDQFLSTSYWFCLRCISVERDHVKNMHHESKSRMN